MDKNQLKMDHGYACHIENHTALQRHIGVKSLGLWVTQQFVKYDTKSTSDKRKHKNKSDLHPIKLFLCANKTIKKVKR